MTSKTTMTTDTSSIALKRVQLLRKNASLTSDDHKDIARAALWAGQLLLQHGAETQLVEETIHRLGTALGCDWLDIAISADSITITTIYQNTFLTKVRRVPDRGINMKVVCSVVQVCDMAEKGLCDTELVMHRLRQLSDKQPRYNRWLMMVMVGLSCSCFSRLAGADMAVFVVTFFASSIATFVRQEFAHRHFSPLVNFTVTAFVATIIASTATLFKLSPEPHLAMSSSVLMLVPGFPFVNALSDMVKGHVNTGIARWGVATILILATALGIMLGMTVTGVWSWL